MDVKKVQEKMAAFPNRFELDDNSAGKGLSEQQIRFCQYYVITGQARVAGELAGYSEVINQPRRLLRQEKVKAYIAEIKAEQLIAKGYTKEDILDKLISIANTDVTDFIDVYNPQYDADGKMVSKASIEMKDIDGIKRQQAVDTDGNPLVTKDGKPVMINTGKTLAIKQIKLNAQGNIEASFYDRLQALDSLAKIMGITKETVDLNVDNSKIEKAQASLDEKMALFASKKTAGDGSNAE